MTKLFRRGSLKAAILLLDIAAACGSYLLAYAWRFSGPVPHGEWQTFREYAPWLAVFTALIYYFFSLYDFSGRRKLSVVLFNLILAHAALAAGLIVADYWLQAFVLPRSVVAAAFLLQVLLTFGLRLALLGFQTSGGRRKQALAVIGGRPADRQLLEKLLQQGGPWLKVRKVAVADAQPAAERFAADKLEWGEFDLLLLGQGVPDKDKADLLLLAGKHGKEVLLIPDFYELYMMNAETQQIGDLLVYSLMPPEPSLPDRLFKRGLDISLSLLLLAVTSPLLLAAFVLIPATSKGKALFTQERIGRGGKPFQLVKFRTMIDNAEAATGPVLAGDGDKRITRLGRLLRASRIDELPQLFNVLAGDMSLVGPRPERAFFIQQFEAELPFYSYRLLVKPGLTGLAQVMAGYTTPAADKLRYDLMYIRQLSLLLDLKILFQTLLVVLNREQSRGVSAADEALLARVDDLLAQGPQELLAARK